MGMVDYCRNEIKLRKGCPFWRRLLRRRVGAGRLAGGKWCLLRSRPMSATWLSLALTLLMAGSDGKSDKSDKSDKERKPHPFAPSLAELTEEEEDKLDKIIDRFMEYDVGKLKGAEGLQALRAFEKLGPDAIPALLRGLNRAAAINHSCPA